MQATQGLLLPLARPHQTAAIEIEHPEPTLGIYLQVVRVHIRMKDTGRMKLANRLPQGEPKIGCPTLCRNETRQWLHARYANRNDIGCVDRPVAPIASGSWPRYPQSAICHFRKQPPFGERPRIVLARPDVAVLDQLAYETAANEVP